MFHPTPAGSHSLLNTDGGLGIPRAPSALGMQPGNSLPQGTDPFSSQDGRSQSPAGSLSATPRPGLHPADPSFLGQQLQPNSSAAAVGSSGLQVSSTWSSLDGIQRAFQGGSDIALQPAQQQQGLSAGPSSLARAATYNLGSQQSLSGSLDGVLNRGASVPPIGQHHQAFSNQHRPPGLLTGLTLQQQQQLLQAQALQQQQQQQKSSGYPLNGFNVAPQGNMQPLAHLQAAAQAAQIAAAQRQQQLLRNQGYGVGQHNVNNLSNLGSAGLQNNQNLLLQQALLNQQLNQAALLNQAVANRAHQQQHQTQQLQNQLLQGQLGNLALQQGLGAANMGSAGLRPGALNGLNNTGAGINPAVAAALLNGGLQGNNNLHAFTAQMQNMQNAQQLLSQAFRTNQTAFPQARPAQGQLQSEALIAMQRQQAMQNQGARGVPGSVGGLPNDALAQLAQLGLLGKQASAQGNLGITPQQQAALLSALQAGNQGKPNVPNVQQPQQQRGALPPGLANGASFLNGSAQVRPLGVPLNQLQASNGILASSMAQQQHQRGLTMSAPQTPRSTGAQPSILTASLQGGSQSDPIQTLQDIGRTLAQLNITVDAAVNAGLLGGLSASDVRIVGDAHGQEVEKLKLAAANPPGAGGTAPPSMAGTAPASPAGSVASAASAPLPAGHGRTNGSSLGGGDKTQDDQEFPLDVEPEVSKAPVDEDALRKRVEAEAAARFDAGQYGFFAAAPAPVEEGELLTELESGEQGSDIDGGRSSAARTPDPKGLDDKSQAEKYLLWNGADNFLSEELGSKLMLDNAALTAQTTQGEMVAPPVSAIAPQAPAASMDLASLWGAASQGDRNDPFGSATWRSGWTLGTGF